MKKLPSFLKQYFWDVDFDLLNFKESKTFILKRGNGSGIIKGNVIPNTSASLSVNSVRSSTLRDEPSGSDSNENLPSLEDPSPSSPDQDDKFLSNPERIQDVTRNLN